MGAESMRLHLSICSINTEVLRMRIFQSGREKSISKEKCLQVKGILLLLFMLSLLQAGPAAAAKTDNQSSTDISREVSLPKRGLILTQYEKIKLNIRKESGTVSWSSSDKKIASVSRNGIVRTKKTGRCKITAKVNGKTYVCRVRVKALALDKTELTLVRGRQMQLTLNNTGIKPAWESSNEKVASVSDEGIVQALTPGTSKIRGRYKSAEVICSVKVIGITPSTLQEMYTADKANRKKVLLAGSSSMDYWNNAPQAFAPYEIINMAIGGTTVTQWLDWYESMIVRYKPSAVVLYVGSNDLGNGGVISGQTNASNTIRLLKAIRQSLRKVPIFYIGISPCWFRKGAWQDIAASNALVKNYCSQETNMFYIDIAAACAASDGTPDKSLFLSDQLHPNAAGYRVWERAVAKPVKKLLRQIKKQSKKSK